MARALQRARIAIPPLPPRHLPRARLLTALDEAVARPLTLLAAGPGSGKTVLLSAWAGRREIPPAWVSLERADNEPNRFLTAVAAALKAAGVATGPAHPLGNLSAQEGFAALLDASDHELPIVLVLDDAHVLTHREILDGLDGWLRRWSRQMRLVIAARSDPLLPLHRYRLAGAMSELRAVDLAMTSSEAKDLLSSHGVQLPERQLEVLTTRTEGWIAGLRLSAMSMEGAERATDFITDLALDEGSIGEYLMDEVLARQPPDVRRLLIETSFLREINGDLAQAITGLSAAGAMLTELSRANAFVLPLDRSGSSFRYHQLLAEILRYLLRREPASYRAELVRRASAWYLEAGDLVSALHFSVVAEDWRAVARVLVQGGFVHAFVDRLDLAPMRGESLAELATGDDDVEPILAAAAIFVLAGRAGRAREQVARLAGATTALEPAQALTADVVALMVARAQHRVREADTTAQRLLEVSALDGRRDLAAAVRVEQAMTHFYAGSHSSVEAVLRTATDDANAAEVTHLELECLAHLAHVNAFWGRFRTSLADERRASMLLRRDAGLTTPATLLLAASQRAVVKAEFALATKAILRAASLATEPRQDDVRAEIAVVRAMLYINSGRLDDARAAIGRPSTTPRGVIRDYRLATLADIDIRSGRPELAIQALDVAASNPPSSVVCLARATAYLVLGDFEGAEAAIRPILTASGVPSIRAVLVSALVLQAKILHTRGDPDGRAAESLVRAIELSDGEIILPFVRTYDLLSDVIANHPLLADQWPIQPEHPVEARGDKELQLGTDPLTDKERAVLRWLATSMSTSEIAAELGLSVNTVKTHIAAIYRKLAAVRRRDAVVRARRLELL